MVEWFANLPKEERGDFEKHMADGLEHLLGNLTNNGAEVVGNLSSGGVDGEDVEDRGLLMGLGAGLFYGALEALFIGITGGIAVAAQNAELGVKKSQPVEKPSGLPDNVLTAHFGV